MSLVSTCSFCGHQAVMHHSGGCCACISQIFRNTRKLKRFSIIVCSSCGKKKPVANKKFGLCHDCVELIKQRERNWQRQVKYDRKHHVIRHGNCNTGPLIKIHKLPKEACRICWQVKPFIRYRLRICHDCAKQVAANKQARIQASEEQWERQRQFAEMMKKSFGSEIETVPISKKELKRLDRQTQNSLEALARGEGKVCINCGRKGLLGDNELKLCAGCVELIINKLQPKEIAT